jgi:hypothetical protein
MHFILENFKRQEHLAKCDGPSFLKCPSWKSNESPSLVRKRRGNMGFYHFSQSKTKLEKETMPRMIG